VTFAAISVELVVQLHPSPLVAMYRIALALAASLLSLSATAAEPLPPDGSAPAEAPVVDANQLALHQYFYIDFPRQLEALQYKRYLAEAEIALIARRLETFRPSRSFGRYSATYTADLAAQIDLLAAQRALACLRDAEADLWRQRRLLAEEAMASSDAGLR
jgi:hypothetical protein